MIEFVCLGEKVQATEEHYANNGRLAIELVSENGDPFATLTCNITHAELADGEFLVKTWSENTPVAEAALQSGCFVDTGRRVKAGYTEAQIWRLAPGVTI